jgi:hypothetical protein
MGRESRHEATECMLVLSPDTDPGRDPVEVGRRVVLGQILAAGARKSLIEPLAVAKGLPIGIEVDGFAVPSERDIGRIAVHVGIGQRVDPIDRGALALMEGDRVAVSNRAVALGIEGDPATVVQAGDETAGLHLLDSSEGPVLDARALCAGVEVCDLSAAS